jgi:UDP-N-acetylmuramate dehydrogenase
LAVAGGLSNTVLGERISQDLVLYRDGEIIDITESADAVIVRVEGSCELDRLVDTLCCQRIPGTELLSGIPGTVGAAIAQNVAAYGQELSKHLISATAFDLETRNVVDLPIEHLGLGYRSSRLKAAESYTPPVIILEATFRFLRKVEEIRYRDIREFLAQNALAWEDIQARRAAVLSVRQRKGMVVDGENWTPCAGSFFVSPEVPTETAVAIAERVRGEHFATSFLDWYNPDRASTRVPAALVLRAAGFMNGDRWGPVGLSPHHILAVCTYPGATGSDVSGLAQLILSRVRSRLGISLHPEVRILGSIEDDSVDRFESRNTHSPGLSEPDWATGLGVPANDQVAI